MIRLPIQDRKIPIPKELLFPQLGRDYVNVDGNLFLEQGSSLKTDDVGQCVVQGLIYIGFEYLIPFHERELNDKEQQIAEEKGFRDLPVYSADYFEACICMRELQTNIRLRHIWNSFRLLNLHPLFGYIFV